MTTTVQSRSWWGYGIAAVYTTFALSTIGFAVFAFTQKVDLVDDNYYAQSVAYQEHVQQVHNSSTLERNVTCTINKTTETILLAFPQTSPSGKVVLYRPSQTGIDRTIQLSTDETGKQLIPYHGIMSGKWIIKCTWQCNGVSYYHEQGIEL